MGSRARFGLPEPPHSQRMPPRTPDAGVGVKPTAGPGKVSSIPVPRPRMALRARPPVEKETNVGKDGKPLWR